MAKVFPFQPYRYTAAAGPLDVLVTQPYDKITPVMRSRYLSLSPNNLVRVILGESSPSDTAGNNVYTRAAGHLESWIASGVLARDPEPAFFAYFQEYRVPETEDVRIRKGFIGLGAVEDYSEGVVHRHEQTLSGPKQDRLELLRHTHAHFGQIFMLYPDPDFALDRLLDEAAQSAPLARLADEYGVIHTVWRISDPDRVARISQLMGDKKLLIADGHHRYETALAFRRENPNLPGADRVMMTFVNMHSPGLTILSTHRLVRGLPSFRPEEFLRKLQPRFRVSTLDSAEDLRRTLAHEEAGTVAIGLYIGGHARFHLLETPRQSPDELDVAVLHQALLGDALGISEAEVKGGRLGYVRGIEPAMEEVRRGEAEMAFLLKPVSVEQVGRIAFSGGVMPQKSTDFYPKLLSGLTIYKVG